MVKKLYCVKILYAEEFAPFELRSVMVVIYWHRHCLEIEKTRLNMLENILEVVAFTIGNNEFCIDIKHINAIILYDKAIFRDINQNCKDIQYNGKTIRLFDFNSLIDTNSDQINMETRIVVLEIDKKFFGFPVKKIVEFRSVKQEDYTAYDFGYNGHSNLSDNSENSNGYVISKLKAAKIFLYQTA